MIIEKLTVHKVFPIGPYANIRIGVEGSVTKEEDINVAITDAEELLNNWFANSYPNVAQSAGYIQEPVEDFFSGPIPTNNNKKEFVRNRQQSKLMPPPPDIRERYTIAESKGDITTMRNLEKAYNFN